MQSLYSILLAVHISAGTISLLSGTMAAIAQKGGRVHKATGFVFYYAMIVTGISAMVICQIPNHASDLLLGVGGFTLQMVVTGGRVVQAKKTGKNWVDYTVVFLGICFALFMLYNGINLLVAGRMFGMVSCVFGSISLFYVWLDIRWLFFVAIKQVWMANHISRMVGALIASYTAFLVVNINAVYPFNLLVWLGPTLVGSVFIARMRSKYVKPMFRLKTK